MDQNDIVDLTQGFDPQPRFITGGVRTPLMTYRYPELPLEALPEQVAARVREAQVPEIALDPTMRAARRQGAMNDIGLVAFGRDCALFNRVAQATNARIIRWLSNLRTMKDAYARQVAAHNTTIEHLAHLDEVHAQERDVNAALRAENAALATQLRDSLRDRQRVDRPTTRSTASISASWDYAYVRVESDTLHGKPTRPTLTIGVTFGDRLIERGLSFKLMTHRIAYLDDHTPSDALLATRSESLCEGVGVGLGVNGTTDWHLFLHADMPVLEQVRAETTVKLPVHSASTNENWSLYATAVTPNVSPRPGFHMEGTYTTCVFSRTTAFRGAMREAMASRSDTPMANAKTASAKPASTFANAEVRHMPFALVTANRGASRSDNRGAMTTSMATPMASPMASPSTCQSSRVHTSLFAAVLLCVSAIVVRYCSTKPRRTIR